MYKLYINGTCETGAGDKLDVTCPATGELLETISTASIEQADRALEAAQAAFPSWSRLSLNERIGWMMKLKDACLAEKTAIIDLMAKEGGKSYKEAGNDFNAFIGYFGGQASLWHGYSGVRRSPGKFPCGSQAAGGRCSGTSGLEYASEQCGPEAVPCYGVRLYLRTEAQHRDSIGQLKNW